MAQRGKAQGAARWILGVAVLGATVALAVLSARPVAAADPDITVTAIPGQLSLAPGDRAEIAVIVGNQTDSAVRVATAQVLAPARVTVEDQPKPSRELAPRSVARLTFGLRTERGFEEGIVAVLVGVDRQEGPGTVRQRVLWSTVNVKRGTTPDALTASFVSSPKKLGDGQRATARLRVANETPFTFKQVVVTGLAGRDVSVVEGGNVKETGCPASWPDGTLVRCIETLGPGEWQIVTVVLQAAEAVHPGEDKVSVAVTGAPATLPPRLVPPASVVAATTLDLSVFGIDALGAFGVVSVFLLPGLMAVVMFVLLSHYAYPRRKGTPDTVDVRDPRTMVFVVPVAALVYLAAAVIFRVDLTDAISTIYVLFLFVTGLSLGFSAWIVYAVLYFQRSGRLQFAKDDSPEKVLERLERRRGLLEVPEAKVGSRTYCFLGEAPDGGITVCSPIVAQYTTEDAGLRGRFRTAKEAGDVAALRRTVELGAVRLSWALGSGVAVFPGDKVEQGQTLCLIEVRE